MTEPRVLYAALHLLDRQIVDQDGRMAGKVDDVEIEVPDDPGADLPVVTALLSGAGALAERVEGRLGGWIASVDRRLTNEGSPSRIPFELVSDLGSHLTVTVSRRQLETDRAEQWARDAIIDHIPGAGHAPE